MLNFNTVPGHKCIKVTHFPKVNRTKANELEEDWRDGGEMN